MTRKMKAYLPRWSLWVTVPMMTLLWAFMTYSAFVTESGREELGVVGWALMTIVFLLIGVMLWLMASGRLPAYVIEVDDADEPQKR